MRRLEGGKERGRGREDIYIAERARSSFQLAAWMKVKFLFELLSSKKLKS